MMSTFPRRLAALSLLACLAAPAHACGGRLHIEVREDAVVMLDYAAIVAAQPQFKDCASADLQLTQRGQEVAIRIVDDGHGRFAPGSSIAWLGQALRGPQSWYDPYSTVNVYQLAASAGTHARVREPGAAAATPGVPLQRSLHLEQENLLLRLNSREMKPGDEPDVWQWAKLTPIDPQPFALAFDLADLDARDAGKSAAKFTLALRGVSNVIAVDGQTKPLDHVVEVSLNGKLLQTLQWDGRDEFRKTFEVPRALLKPAGNSLTARVPKRALPNDAANFIVDAVMFNWLEVAYPAGGDVRASGLGLSVPADGSADLSANAEEAPEIFGSDGSYQRAMPAGSGRYRAALVHGVEYHALQADAHPALVRAVAPEDPRAAEPGFDYLIVAHPSLLEAIQPLAQLHRQQGLKVAVYDVDDVYDAFNGGIAHPAAIRDLVAWGTQHWAVKPRYLLLVGDASTDIHHDPRNGVLNGSSYSLTTLPRPAQVLQGAGFAEMKSYAYPDQQQRTATRNLIPTWQYPSGEGQSASDNGYATMKQGDFHPTLAVGRFPVVEPAEVKAIVAKTIDYIAKPMPGPWHRDVTFISTSELAAFKQASDQFSSELDQRGFITRNIYTDAEDRDPGHYSQARSTLRDDLDGGGLLVHFLGHGGSYIWRVGAMGDLFSLDDVSALKNAGRYPMVLAMTCFSAPFDNPSDDSIGERFLREADKGAVAVFAASWKNWPNPIYSRDLIEELLKPGVRIGDAIVAAKAKMPARDFVEIYNLLGDPALVLAQPPGQLQFMLSADRWNPRVLVRVPASDFGGNVDVDWLDAKGVTLASAHYELRDTQFSLPLIEHAVTARVYAADARNGFAAFGAASLLPPPPKVVPPQLAAHGAASAAVPASAAAAATPAIPKATPVPVPRYPHVHDPRDDIAQMDFEARAAAPRTPVSKH